MAKKKADSEGLNLEDLAVVSIAPGESSVEASFPPPSSYDETPSAYYPDDYAYPPPSPLFAEDEDVQITRFAVPRAVLYALLDPAFEDADLQRAETLGLSVDGKPTKLGLLVLNGTDVIALRHKMTRAYRAAQFKAMGRKAG